MSGLAGPDPEGRVGLFIRAEVGPNGDLRAFDGWYGSHHMPAASKVFGAPSVRFWSLDDSRAHYALYEFAELSQMEERLATPEAKAFSTDFDETCPTEATRARETWRVAQWIPTSSDRDRGWMPQGDSGVFMIRAVLRDSKEVDDFDSWYQTHHLPLAAELFGTAATRFWSIEEPLAHLAMYEFSDMKVLEERLDTSVLEELIADFDDSCPAETTRVRERLSAVQSISVA